MHSYHSTKEMGVEGARERATACVNGGEGGGWLMNVVERCIMGDSPRACPCFGTAVAHGSL